MWGRTEEGRVPFRWRRGSGLLLAAVAALCSFFLPNPAGAIDAREAVIAAEASQTTFKMVLSEGVTAEVFTLANPYRVVIDLPDVAFRLREGTGLTGGGLISTFRFGLFAEGQGRVVIDTTGPVKISAAGMTRQGSDGSVVLKVVLVPTDPATFAAGVLPPKPKAEAAQEALEAPSPDKPSTRPVIVIDAGHGGIDPGTTGLKNLAEKNLVLEVAQRLEAEIKKSGRYEVKMTRTRDVFVSLDRRLEMSREFGADLFVSLHADSISESAFAESVRGATVYTLSEQASDEQARRMAEKENASDLLAGIDGVDVSGKDQVRDILIDLLKRETANFSADFSNLLVSRLKQSVRLSKDPQRSAAFKVLKQTHAPSVLVELGYMSNSKDQSEMTSPEWQTKVAHSIGNAVERYFAKRTAGRP